MSTPLPDPGPGGLHVVTVDVAHLGNRCHLVHDGRVGLVVDAPRDLAAVEQAVEEAGVEVGAVAETHVHNDYVSGGPALAARHGVDLLVSADEALALHRVGVRDGDVVELGDLRVEVLDTPGHTPHHQSFLARLAQHEHHPDHDAALLSGGSLLHGTVGRTDLVDPARSLEHARVQWASARRQGALPAPTRLLPTHGFGSFCAGAGVDVPDGPVTVGDQQALNPALREAREPFAARLVASLGPVPGHYARMDTLNRAGIGRSPGRPATPVSAEEVADAVLRGAWVVDLRERTTYAAGHLPGSVNVGWSDQCATYVGWLVTGHDRHDDLVLLADSPSVLDGAVRHLADLGIDGVARHELAPTTDLPASYRVATWADWRELRGARPGSGAPVLLDVRQSDEHDEEHLVGAVHLAVQDVETGAATLPPGELWVHCRSGYRAGIAASLLHRQGRAVVHLDDSWERVADLALPTRRAGAPDLGVSA